MRFHVLRRRISNRNPFRAKSLLATQRLPGDFLLHREDILQFPIECSRPELNSIGGVNEFGDNPNLVSLFGTVPSRSVLTPSFSPIVLGSSFLSLKRKEELRPITLRSLIGPRAAINSSDRPSEKYSSRGSPLSLSNGSTAIDFCGDPAIAEGCPRSIHAVREAV